MSDPMLPTTREYQQWADDDPTTPMTPTPETLRAALLRIYDLSMLDGITARLDIREVARAALQGDAAAPRLDFDIHPALHAILDRPFADPDDDAAIVARALMRLAADRLGDTDATVGGLREAVLVAEWRDRPNAPEGIGRCPSCGAHKVYGHYPDCWMGELAALAAATSSADPRPLDGHTYGCNWKACTCGALDRDYIRRSEAAQLAAEAVRAATSSVDAGAGGLATAHRKVDVMLLRRALERGLSAVDDEWTIEELAELSAVEYANLEGGTE